MEVWKYKVQPLTDNRIPVPSTHQVLSFGLDPDGYLCVWILVNPLEPNTSEAVIGILGTGVGHTLLGHRFIGTVRQGDYMWHAFVN